MNICIDDIKILGRVPLEDKVNISLANVYTLERSVVIDY